MWGEDRDTAIRRMLRALREFRIEGIATTIPADVAILEHPDFAAATHSTKWVEDTLDLTGVDAPPTPADATDGDAEAKVQRDVDVEVNGKRFAVERVGARVAGRAPWWRPARGRGRRGPTPPRGGVGRRWRRRRHRAPSPCPCRAPS